MIDCGKRLACVSNALAERFPHGYGKLGTVLSDESGPGIQFAAHTSLNWMMMTAERGLA